MRAKRKYLMDENNYENEWIVLRQRTNFIASLTLYLFQARVIFERHFFSMRRPFVLTGTRSGLDVRAVLLPKDMFKILDRL